MTRGVETYTVVTKRVTEMEDAASPVVAEMKRKNILTPGGEGNPLEE